MSGFEKFWFQSCENRKIPHDIATKWLKSIQTKYDSESHRIHHNFNVLKNKFEFLQSIESSVDYSDSLIFAIIFQYYHFDVQTSDCCEKNSTAFREFSDESCINNASLIDSVCYLLGDTNKTFSGDAHDVELFQDLDLIVLGASPNEFKEYQQATRTEYSHLDEDTYKSTRLRILETFSQIPQIYSVPCICERLEDSARANIKQEIAELKNYLTE